MLWNYQVYRKQKDNRVYEQHVLFTLLKIKTEKLKFSCQIFFLNGLLLINKKI